MTATGGWRRCSSCKTEIGFGRPYWVCSVTTCNRDRTGLVFCSDNCWEAHVPVMRHREAWAVEKRAPSGPNAGLAPAPATPPAPASAPKRASAPPPRASSAPAAELEREILVVASKLKAYVRARSEMSTSDKVMDVLSDRLRALCDQAIRKAAADGRKTVLERDFK
jgi:histone H3/H4